MDAWQVLARELLDYEIRVSEDANDRYGAFKVGNDDDLVTALGLAAQETPPEPWSGPDWSLYRRRHIGGLLASRWLMDPL